MVHLGSYVIESDFVIMEYCLGRTIFVVAGTSTTIEEILSIHCMFSSEYLKIYENEKTIKFWEFKFCTISSLIEIIYSINYEL
jgi:hypothetical protein